MSDSVRPHRRQPTRLPCPWDSPGKNTAVGCHFLLQCMKVKSEREVAQSCPTLRDPMHCSLPGFSVHGIFLARVLQWGVIAFSGDNLTQVHKGFWTRLFTALWVMIHRRPGGKNVANWNWFDWANNGVAEQQNALCIYKEWNICMSCNRF